MRLHRLPARAAWLFAACATSALAQPAPAVRGEPAPVTTPAQPPVQPIIIHSKEYIGSHEPGRQDRQAARQEAAAALAEARTRCRRERDRDMRDECLQQAQARHRAALQAPTRAD